MFFNQVITDSRIALYRKDIARIKCAPLIVCGYTLRVNLFLLAADCDLVGQIITTHNFTYISAK